MIDMSIEELRQAAKYLGGYYEQIMNQVIDRLEVADKEIESWKGVAKQLGNDADILRTHLSFAKDELNRLRTRIEQMERQESVGTTGGMPGTTGYTMACFHADKVPIGTKLYTLPGAKGESE